MIPAVVSFIPSFDKYLLNTRYVPGTNVEKEKKKTDLLVQYKL